MIVFAEDGTAGLPEVSTAFLTSPHVSPDLVPKNWLANHYRWIVWKLACVERAFPEYLHNRLLDFITKEQALLTIWRPSEEDVNELYEHKAYDFYDLDAVGTSVVHWIGIVIALTFSGGELQTSTYCLNSRRRRQHFQMKPLELRIIRNVNVLTTESDDLVEKMTQLCQLFDGEKVDLNKEEFVKIRNRLAQEKRSLLSENGDLKSKLASAQSKMSELVGELVTLIGEDSADSPPAVIVSKLSSKMKSLTLEIEKLSAINEGNVDEICNCRKEIAQHLATIGEAHEELALLRERLRKTEVELETLRGQHRMVRDRNQIKDLSSELWETSDRYLLASQEAEALRNQLRRTKAALEIVANRTPQKSNAIPQGSHPCLWTRA
ncbi:unnamed protein product [Nesidiocoris tenuis]|uniref:Breast cancer type 2 susceptibility protein helical domain-containing protein n=1 Tax=Nesidiocoris tenuis TaxID=355587 RepID=A0A6H5HA93_9HEMI|nr:unnamed protein product [Nesidiocoris tenuis]